ncbi:hypothetical protein [Streptomyces zagrosensis]|uniref:Uncharacterized protein n=1 Tax=Streptomyces zagrosensis TaxID=1042984 RepID=A0A7W9QHE7_9ACTN|nr:hypothetical protein [Streptomyces zagrosensis]MBB5940074.1 hypothetical protein [Streptomyces zagrosensis]
MLTTPLGALPYPQPTDTADIPAHLRSLAQAVDGRTVLRFDDDADRTAKVTSPQAGMVAWLAKPGLLTLHNGSGWVSVHSPTDTGWLPLTPASGYVTGITGSAAHPPAQYRKIDNRVHLRGWISHGTAATVIPRNTTLLTLPAGCRPASAASFAAVCQEATTANYNEHGTTRLEITTGGLVKNLGQHTVAGYTHIGLPDNAFFFLD